MGESVLGPLRMSLLIIAMVPIGGVANKAINGEIHTLTDVGTTLMHGIPVALGLACGWIFFKSPWAIEFQALSFQKTDTVVTKPSGAVVEQHIETIVAIPPPQNTPPPEAKPKYEIPWKL